MIFFKIDCFVELLWTAASVKLIFIFLKTGLMKISNFFLADLLTFFWKYPNHLNSGKEIIVHTSVYPANLKSNGTYFNSKPCLMATYEKKLLWFWRVVNFCKFFWKHEIREN